MESLDVQNTPPTPTRLNCRVESPRRCVHNSQLVGDSLNDSEQICQQRSWVASCRRCEYSRRQLWVVSQITISCTVEPITVLLGYWSRSKPLWSRPYVWSVSKLLIESVGMQSSYEFCSHRRRRRDATRLDSCVAWASSYLHTSIGPKTLPENRVRRTVLNWGVLYMCIVSQKNPPWGFVAIFPKWLGIFQPNFTCILCVPIYPRLQNFIQLSATLTKLCHITRDHPVHTMCAKCPPSTETHSGWSHLIWHNFVTVGDNWIKICIRACERLIGM